MNEIKTILDKKEKNETISIQKLSHDGRGIASIRQITTFISNSLPNETVSYKITKRSSRYQEADALQIIEPSLERVTPACQHFGVCGGCDLQHMSRDFQLKLKENTLLEQLKHFGQVSPKEILRPLYSESYHYRRKARLGVKFVRKKNKLLVGFREKSSRYLADLARCEVLHPKIGHILPQLSELISHLSNYETIPQIEVAMGETECALIFRHLSAFTIDDQEKLIQFAQQYDFHIYLQPNAPLPISKIWPNDHIHRLQYSLPDLSLTFSFHPLDFTQINLNINRLMIHQALQLLEVTPDDKILDLYCGIGNFTLPLAKYSKQVTGIEGGADMVSRAKENALANHIKTTDFYAADLAKPAQEAPWLNTQYDKLLLDPPRTGAKEILPFFKQLSPRRILYVSCNPATLARDANELVNNQGYILKKVGIIDMFPHTAHTEAMAVFDKE
jgi:23S rRNA (uracil1939-C5)-methyltransferase